MARPMKDPAEKCRNQINLNVPDGLFEGIRTVAYREDKPVAAYVRDVLEREIEREARG